MSEIRLGLGDTCLCRDDLCIQHGKLITRGGKPRLGRGDNGAGSLNPGKGPLGVWRDPASLAARLW